MQIHEVAKRLNISPRAIRFYEEKGLIQPSKQAHNQYRVFSRKDIWQLQTIIALREVGMSLQEIQNALKRIDEGNKDELLYYLELQRSVIFSQWLELQSIISTTDQMIEMLKQEKTLPLDDVYQLAEGSKRLREARNDWEDRWNYDRKAPMHDLQVESSNDSVPLYRQYREALDLIVAWVQARDGETGLDIGTGTGNLAGRFAATGHRMAAIDQSREMLKQCQRKFPSVETALGNFLAIPFLDQRFDFVVTSFAFHHLTDEQKWLSLLEMRRVLKAHGRICIADLMFTDETARKRYMEQLQDTGDGELAELMADRHYVQLTHLLDWFDTHGYITRHRQLNDLLHVVYAVPIR